MLYSYAKRTVLNKLLYHAKLTRTKVSETHLGKNLVLLQSVWVFISNVRNLFQVPGITTVMARCLYTYDVKLSCDIE